MTQDRAAVQTATRDFRAGRVDEPTWQARIEARRAHRLRPKAQPDAEARTRMLCRADGAEVGAGTPGERSGQTRSRSTPSTARLVARTQPPEQLFNKSSAKPAKKREDLIHAVLCAGNGPIVAALCVVSRACR